MNIIELIKDIKNGYPHEGFFRNLRYRIFEKVVYGYLDLSDKYPILWLPMRWAGWKKVVIKKDK